MNLIGTFHRPYPNYDDCYTLVIIKNDILIILLVILHLSCFTPSDAKHVKLLHLYLGLLKVILSSYRSSCSLVHFNAFIILSLISSSYSVTTSLQKPDLLKQLQYSEGLLGLALHAMSIFSPSNFTSLFKIFILLLF